MNGLLERLDSIRKEYIYRDVKRILERLLLDGGEVFDMEWFKENIESVKKAFVNKPYLRIWCNYGKAKHDYSKANIEEICIEDERLLIRGRTNGKGFSIDFDRPSEGCIQIVGNRYALYLFSRKNRPSQIILSYFNI